MLQTVLETHRPPRMRLESGVALRGAEKRLNNSYKRGGRNVDTSSLRREAWINSHVAFRTFVGI